MYLFAGESSGTPSGVVSNIGYLQARYTFPNGLVESDGLWATFACARPYRYRTMQPAGYTLSFEGAQLTVQRSGVQTGSLNTVKAVLPKTGVLDKDGNTVPVPQTGGRPDTTHNQLWFIQGNDPFEITLEAGTEAGCRVGFMGAQAYLEVSSPGRGEDRLRIEGIGTAAPVCTWVNGADRKRQATVRARQELGASTSLP